MISKEKKSEDEHLALYEAILTLKNVSEAAKFFTDLCTPVELQDMSDRWQVVAPLKENIPYRKIYEETGVSVTTIGRVARAIHYGTGGYDLVYTRMSRKYERKNKTKNRTTKKWETK